MLGRYINDTIMDPGVELDDLHGDFLYWVNEFTGS
uniref:Uncharacterized protein n=1 Tax=Candidatus Kentrum sp. FW TaxID=2126338 RepID=A0A450SYC2_9GAMM|nr:MAG: hypothetical protein BECKFW1821A_GA0114235_108710 [Candidatus Kentron sp. FW]